MNSLTYLIWIKFLNCPWVILKTPYAVCVPLSLITNSQCYVFLIHVVHGRLLLHILLKFGYMPSSTIYDSNNVLLRDISRDTSATAVTTACNLAVFLQSSTNMYKIKTRTVTLWNDKPNELTNNHIRYVYDVAYRSLNTRWDIICCSEDRRPDHLLYTPRTETPTPTHF